MSSHPGPPPSCAEGPPPRRLPRATGRLDSELADVEFFVRREHIFDAGLLRRSPDPAEPSTSFYSSTRHLPTSPALTSTPPPASHRRPPPPKMPRHGSLFPVSLSPLQTPSWNPLDADYLLDPFQPPSHRRWPGSTGTAACAIGDFPLPCSSVGPPAQLVWA
jgi:hypothetical protein